MSHTCKSIGCCNPKLLDQDFCGPCLNKEAGESLIDRYPDQYRSVGDLSEIDPFAVLNLFEIPDHSGCLQQAAHKLLMTGTSQQLYRDVMSARDSLTRWLQLNQELNT